MSVLIWKTNPDKTEVFSRWNGFDLTLKFEPQTDGLGPWHLYVNGRKIARCARKAARWTSIRAAKDAVEDAANAVLHQMIDERRKVAHPTLQQQTA